MIAKTSSGLGRTIAPRWATIGAMAGIALLIAFNLEPSSIRAVGPYSYLKAAILAGLVGMAVYLGVTVRHARLQRIHHFIAYGVLCNVVLLEVAFRTFPSLVPPNLLALLPAAERGRVATDLGLMTEGSFRGDGMLYSFRSGAAQLKAYPWVTTDEDGFRNPTAPKGRVDAVLFGDSVTFARHARKDLGELLRDKGIAAYNLGMGGHSPFHYRDAYRRYVVERGLAHDHVLVFASFGGTDFADATKYAHVVRQGGDWRDYLGEATAIGPEWPDRQPFWMVAFAARAPAYLRTQLSDVGRILNRLAGQKADIVLPYATFSVTPQILDLPDIAATSEGWRDFAAAIDDLVGLAAGAKATVAIVLMPNAGLLYRDSVVGFDGFKQTLDARYQTIVGLIEARYRPRGVTVLSMVGPLARAVAERPIAAGPLDFHFGTEGWAIVRDELMAALRLKGHTQLGARTGADDRPDADGS